MGARSGAVAPTAPIARVRAAHISTGRLDTVESVTALACWRRRREREVWLQTNFFVQGRRPTSYHPVEQVLNGKEQLQMATSVCVDLQPGLRLNHDRSIAVARHRGNKPTVGDWGRRSGTVIRCLVIR